MRPTVTAVPPTHGPLTHGELLDLLRRRGPTTRRDLLALTHLSRSTLVERLESLQRLHLVREGERRSAVNGRPPVLLEFDHASRVTLVIDLGATHAVVALTDLSARILALRRLRIDLSRRPQRVLSTVTRAATAMLDGQDAGARGLLGVALSFPGLVGRSPGTIEAPAVLAHWDGVPGGDILTEAFGVPSLLLNDAHAMAYGDYLADGRRRTLLGVKVATGIGAGLVVDGHLHLGDSHGAGQFGHMRVPGLDEPCTCGQHGCLATVASGRALLRRLGPDGIDSLEALARAAAAGHGPTLAALEEAGRAVGTVLSGVATMIDPGVIMFGGTLGTLQPFLDTASQEIRALTYPRTSRHIEIRPSLLGDQAVVTGLAALVVDTQLDPRGVDRLVAADQGRVPVR
jgi:predicted NBD/HSP70 family sugar kinase